MLSAFVSFPFIPGHENVGMIVEAGPEVDGFAVGDRVVVEPLLPCVTRGIADPCEFCQRQEFSLCQNFARGDLAPGFGIGSCRDTGGSWGPYFVAHQSQLLAVPDSVSDENALMAEPFAVALQAVLSNLPAEDENVLVLGAGVIGLCTVAALRAMGIGARVMVIAKYPFQGEMARQLGADVVIDQQATDYYQALAEATGGMLYRPVLGKRVLIAGADWVYECVGSDSSIDDSLRLAGNGSTVVLVGLAAIPKRVDWTPIWMKELTVRGHFWCSTQMFRGQRVRTMQLTLDWMAEGKLNLAPFVTHRFRPEEYRRALAVTTAKGKYRVLKSAFIFE